MKRKLFLLSATVLTLLLLASCSTDDETVVQIGPYVGAWAYVETDVDAGTKIYERVDELAVSERGYEIFPSGQLIVIHGELIGAWPPTSIESEGIWSEEEGGEILFSYDYGDWTRLLGIEILYLGDYEMECVETRLNW